MPKCSQRGEEGKEKELYKFIICQNGSISVLGSSEETSKNGLFSGAVFVFFPEYSLNMSKRERKVKLFTDSSGIHAFIRYKLKAAESPSCEL